MKIDTIKESTPESQPHVVPKVVIITKDCTRMDIPRAHKYNTRSTTKRVNHVTKFKNAPNFFPMEPTEKIVLTEARLP